MVMSKLQMAAIMACGEGLCMDNQQQVVSVTDRVLGGQVWYNVERSRKPQTFLQVWHKQVCTDTCRHTDTATGPAPRADLGNLHVRQSPSKIQLMEAGLATSASGAL